MNDRYIKSDKVRELLGGISQTTLWRRVKDGTIPTPVKLGGGSTNFYRESWIQNIIDGDSHE